MADRPSRLVGSLALCAVHLVAAVAYCANTASGTTSARTGFPLDDAWIHLVYGRALAEHGGPFYNDGVLETGFSSPLWMVCGAVAHWITAATGAPVVLVVKALGIAAAALTSVLVYDLATTVTGSRPPAFAVALLHAAHPIVAFAQVSGMEACLTGALLVATARALLAERWLEAGCLAALSGLARPEAFALLPLVVSVALLNRPKTTRADVMRLGAPSLVAALSWSAFCWFVTAHPLPSTFYAKHEHRHVLGNLLHALDAVWLEAPTSALGGATVLYVAGVLGLSRSLRRKSAAVVLPPWLFVAAVAGTRHMPAETWRYFYWLRYVEPALPLFLVPLSPGMRFLDSSIRRVGRSVPALSDVTVRHIARVSTLFATASAFLGYLDAHAEAAVRYSWNCRNIEDVQVLAGKTLAAWVPRGDAIVSDDAGAIRYLSERTTIDLLGLNAHALLFDPETMVKVQRRPATLAAFARAHRARYLVIHPAIFGRLFGSPDLPRYFRIAAVTRAENFTLAHADEGIALILERIDPAS